MSGTTDSVQRVAPLGVQQTSFPAAVCHALALAVHARRIYSAEMVNTGGTLTAGMVRGTGSHRTVRTFTVPSSGVGDLDTAGLLVAGELDRWDAETMGVPACWGTGHPMGGD